MRDLLNAFAFVPPVVRKPAVRIVPPIPKAYILEYPIEFLIITPPTIKTSPIIEQINSGSFDEVAYT